MACGIGIIHQELSLFPNLIDRREHVRRARADGGPGPVDRRRQRTQAEQVMLRLGQDLDPDTLVGDLPIGQQQLVEIGRVLLATSEC